MRFLGILGALIFFSFTLLQLYAGFIGIDYHLGSFWAFLAIVCALLFRFTLPITIGAFFGALNVWEWHWIFALIFIAPGLIFIIPGVLVAIISKIMNCFHHKKKDPKHVIIEGEKGD